MFLPPTLNWPLAVVIFVSVGLVGVLVLYLIVRMRSTNRQHNPSTNTVDDLHSQMEWEDDIGLNITVNPLDETKKSTSPVNVQQTMSEYPGASSDDDDGREQNGYSSEEDENDDYEKNYKHPGKVDHQLEWDDAAIEYGPKKV